MSNCNFVDISTRTKVLQHNKSNYYHIYYELKLFSIEIKSICNVGKCLRTLCLFIYTLCNICTYILYACTID